jgi:hypothetical protein
MLARYSLVLVAAFLLAAAAPQPAAGASASPDTSSIPDVNFTTWDERVGRSPTNVEVGHPASQYTFHGALRDHVGNPINGWPANDIVLEINLPCPNPVALHPDGPSNFAGEVTWSAVKLDQGGGSCIGPMVAAVRFVSIGIYKTFNEVTSPDQDGNGFIALPDLGVFQQAFVNGGPQYQGDLNLSGGPPDLVDLGVFQRHFIAQIGEP